MFEVVALLHNPSVKSFGQVPFVFRNGSSMGISGFALDSDWRSQGLTETDLQNLITGGHARAVRGTVEGPVLPTAAALWLGSSFAVEAISLGLRVEALRLSDPDGTFQIQTSKHVYARLERWTDHAFERARSTRGAEQRAIAVMMRWTLPHHPKTLAALWVSAQDPQQELAWHVRTYRRGNTPEDLVKEYTALLESKS